MKKVGNIVTFAGIVSSVLGMATSGYGEATVSAAADVAALSAYVWRGQVLNDEAVLQPSVTVGKNGFSVNTWFNLNLTDVATGESAEFSEVDLTLAYTKAAGPAALSVGLIEYLFPNQTLVVADGTGAGYPGTREVYASVSLPGLLVVPTLAAYYDVGEAESLYGLMSLAYSVELMKPLSLGLNAAAGYGADDYNTFYFGVDEAAVNDVNLGASLTWIPCDGLAVTPACQYTWLPDSKIEESAAMLYKDNDAFVGSVKATYTF